MNNEKIVIDKNNVLDIARAAVATQGEDFVYAPQDMRISCRFLPIDSDVAYSDDDPRLKTGCGVGTMLKLVGVSDEELHGADGGGGIETVYDEGLLPSVSISPKALKFMNVFQLNNDAGATWGACYKAGEDAMKRMMEGQ